VAIGELTEQDASSLLNDLRLGLNADGYDLEVSGIDDKLRLNIVALENSCEDCLVPAATMSQYAASAIQERYATITPDDIIFRYPVEQH
jgi:hypothetical protein